MTDACRPFAAIMRLRQLLAAVLFVASLSPWSIQAQSTDSTRQKSVLSGVFTEEQAAKGDSEHQANCSACHGAENYTGEAWAKNWIGRTAFDLFDQLKTTMPEDNPGGLSAQQYTDIIAYIFKINGLPAGAAVLPADPEALRLIKIEAKPSSPGLASMRRSSPPRSAVAGSTRRRWTYHPHVPVSRSVKR